MSVDATALRRVVEAILAALPDHVYEPPGGAFTSCLYTHKGGKPGCVIGRGLYALGHEIEHSHEYNVGVSVGGLEARDIITGDPLDIQWLQNVQEGQDAGYAWGVCAQHANGEIRLADV